MMRLFSSRRESINAGVRARAAQFEQRYGRKPSQRELAQLAQASNFATRKGKEGALDFTGLHAAWADKLARTLGIPLAEVAPSVWHAGENATAGTAGNCRTRNSWPAPRSGPSLSRSGRRAPGPAPAWSSTWAGCCPGQEWTRPRPRR
jgi:hypothetical protein